MKAENLLPNKVSDNFEGDSWRLFFRFYSIIIWFFYLFSKNLQHSSAYLSDGIDDYFTVLVYFMDLYYYCLPRGLCYFSFTISFYDVRSSRLVNSTPPYCTDIFSTTFCKNTTRVKLTGKRWEEVNRESLNEEK